MQERLASSDVTHRISMLHPYNTMQQTGLAGQQFNICEALPGKSKPTEHNHYYAQAGTPDKLLQLQGSWIAQMQQMLIRNKTWAAGKEKGEGKEWG